MNLLGVRTVHFPSDESTSRELRNGQYRLSILEVYQGITDIPVCPYYAQLDEIYPGSKFILTTRDVDSWLSSVEEQWYLWRDKDPHKEFTDFVCASVYGSLRFNQKRFGYVYQLHSRNVQEYFAGRPHDLLIMDVFRGDGWDALCEFLGLPIPNRRFPHANRIEDGRIWMEKLERAKEDIDTSIPPGSRVILVDDAALGESIGNGMALVPFLERNGQYWGPPPSDEKAISELKRLRQSGASFIVFAWPAFWWLDFYGVFHRHLRSEYRCTLENDRVIVFDLRTSVERLR